MSQLRKNHVWLPLPRMVGALSTRQVARDNASKMAGGLMHFRNENPMCAWFARLWRLIDPLPESDCDTYLSLLSKLLSMKGTPNDIVPSPDGMQFLVRSGVLFAVHLHVYVHMAGRAPLRVVLYSCCM